MVYLSISLCRQECFEGASNSVCQIIDFIRVLVGVSKNGKHHCWKWFRLIASWLQERSKGCWLDSTLRKPRHLEYRDLTFCRHIERKERNTASINLLLCWPYNFLRAQDRSNLTTTSTTPTPTLSWYCRHYLVICLRKLRSILPHKTVNVSSF